MYQEYSSWLNWDGIVGIIIIVNLFLPFNLAVFHFDLRMAARSYEAGFRKYYGDRLTNISDDTSDEEIRQVYDHWARDYDKLIKMYH